MLFSGASSLCVPRRALGMPAMLLEEESEARGGKELRIHKTTPGTLHTWRGHKKPKDHTY
jgi:hypothetical protein